MTTNEVGTGIKFRENAVTSVDRNAERILIHVKGVEQTIGLRFDQLSENVKAEALGYGMEVRLTRAAALERDSKSGKSASPQDKFDAIKALADWYASGADAWRMPQSGGGGLGQDAKDLVEALKQAMGLDAEQAEAAVKDMSSAERAALALDEEIKPYIELQRQARAKGADTKALKDRILSKL